MDLKEKLDIIWKYSILLVLLLSLWCLHGTMDERCDDGNRCEGHHGQCTMDKPHGDMDGAKMHDMEKMEAEDED